MHCTDCGTRIQSEISKPEITCPHCVETGKLERVIPAPGFKWSVFILGGIFSVIFLTGSRPRRFRCQNCNTAISYRTVWAKIMLGCLVVWLLCGWLPILIYLLICLFFSPK